MVEEHAEAVDVAGRSGGSTGKYFGRDAHWRAGEITRFGDDGFVELEPGAEVSQHGAPV